MQLPASRVKLLVAGACLVAACGLAAGFGGRRLRGWARNGADTNTVDRQAEAIHGMGQPFGLQDLLGHVPMEARGVVVSEHARKESDALARERREQVKGAMRRVWGVYKSHAWGADALAPASMQAVNFWGGVGCTLVDGLDTLWVMGLREEFEEAKDWVRDNLTFAHGVEASVFEVNIRMLGGLLSAYELSGDNVFIEKAQDLADRLMVAFDTPTGLPVSFVNLGKGQQVDPGDNWRTSLAQIGTLQLEFRALSNHTGDPKYAVAVNKVFDDLSTRVWHVKGLFPNGIDIRTGSFTDEIVSFGGGGDSFYEYLLKVWLQGGRKERHYRRMFDDAMEAMMANMLYSPTSSGLLFVSMLNGTEQRIFRMHHLECFLPAVLALGAATVSPDDTDPGRAARYMAAAKALTFTCYMMHHTHPTGLAAEAVLFGDIADGDSKGEGEGKSMRVAAGDTKYTLGPESAEAIFYMHEMTRDPLYREWAWEVFQALERHCSTEGGAYGQYPDVRETGLPPNDVMESFVLAETLKYLYLIQDPDHQIDLFTHVFNTEAHPLRVLEEPPGRTPIPM